MRRRLLPRLVWAVVESGFGEPPFQVFVGSVVFGLGGVNHSQEFVHFKILWNLAHKLFKLCRRLQDICQPHTGQRRF